MANQTYSDNNMDLTDPEKLAIDLIRQGREVIFEAGEKLRGEGLPGPTVNTSL
jgi:hypothetical protein